MQISEVFFWNQNANIGSRNFVIGAKNSKEWNGRGGDGWILVAVQLGGGARASGSCPTPEVAANQVSIHPTAVGSRT